MNFYETNHVTETYLNEIRTHLMETYSIVADQSDTIISEANLAECIGGCPYIAMHYPAAKAAKAIAKTYGLTKSPAVHTEKGAHAAV